MSGWFHWALAGRRALTVLARNPAVNPERLGIFGISMGGTLCWLVAGSDERVKAEAKTGDLRVARKLVTGDPIGVQGYTSDQVFTLYPDPTTQTPILTNKELLLLQAEVNWGKAAYATALGEANFIRTNDGGLAADTSVAADSVLNTILYDKRYSLLWQSGSRWLDARMFGKLNANPPPAGVGVEQEPAPGQPYRSFPIPFNEAVARNNDLTRQACALP